MLKLFALYFFATAEILMGLAQALIMLYSINIDQIYAHHWIILAAGCLSVLFGLGLLLRASFAIKMLIAFAGAVAISKVLILSGVFVLPDYTRIILDKTYENYVSLLYHMTLILFLLHTHDRDLHLGVR